MQENGKTIEKSVKPKGSWFFGKKKIDKPEARLSKI